MKKTILKSTLIAIASVGLFAGSGMASVIPYWKVIDLGTPSESADFSISFEGMSASNISFGIFNTNPTVTAIGTEAQIFNSAADVGYSTHAAFMWDGANYDLTLSFEDNLGNSIGSAVTYDNFGTVFGFYYQDDTSGLFDEIYSDSQFSTNVGLATMNMNHVLGSTDVNVQLLWDDVIISAASINDVSPIPEPATMMLFGAGLAGLAGFSRRKKK